MAEPYKEFSDLIVVLIGSIILDILNHKIEIISTFIPKTSIIICIHIILGLVSFYSPSDLSP